MVPDGDLDFEWAVGGWVSVRAVKVGWVVMDAYSEGMVEMVEEHVLRWLEGGTSVSDCSGSQ
jgi:hypothetical protein